MPTILDLAGLPALALAEDAPVSEMSYILNTFSFLIMGVLVMWMAELTPWPEESATTTPNLPSGSAKWS